MTKRKPSVLSSNVPSTRDICDLLGFYGSEAQRSCKDSAKKWRKAYTSSDGHPGTELLDWNSTTDQEELKVMVVAFLFNAQKKELWKTLGVEPRPSYSDEMTVELFKQLLWRQNRYAAYNTQVKARPSQGSFRVIDWTQDNHHQINRQKRSRPIHQIATDKEAMDQTPPSQQNKREKTSGPDHDIITDKRPVEQSPPSQQCSPALSLESPQTDAVALSPIESQPSQVQHTSILTTTQSKGRIKIPFHIALHSGGKTRQTFWEEGCFGSKSLKEFLPGFAAKLECEANDIERIKLALRLKTLEIEIEMDGRSEDIWEMATATFRYEVRRAQDKGEIDGVDVLVGPVMRKSDPEPGASEEEDREFDL